jgi:hypothetical protein
MEKFYTSEPLLWKTEQVYGPFCSQNYLHPKFSRLIGFFDASVVISIKFCIIKDDPGSGITTQIRFPKNMYRSEAIIPLFPYFYVFIQKQEGQQQENNEKAMLEIFTLVAHKVEKVVPVAPVAPVASLEYRSLAFDDVLQSIPEVVETVVSLTESRGKSPFPSRLFHHKKKFDVPSRSPVPLYDERLPQLISEGCLLVGCKGKLVPIPKPHSPGLYLMSTNEGAGNTPGIEWLLPYPPINK